MKETLARQSVIRCGGTLNKIIIIDEQPVFSHGLAMTLNAEECLILHSQHNDVQHIVAEVLATLCDGVFIGCCSVADLIIIREIASKLQCADIPLFVMMDKNQRQGPVPLIPPGATLIARNETPMKLMYQVNEALGYQVPRLEVSDMATEVCTPELTSQEKRVLREILKGYSLTDTARRLKKSVKTVSAQKQNAIRRLGLKNTQELYQLFMMPGGPCLTD